jgi:hypothetical protein
MSEHSIENSILGTYTVQRMHYLEILKTEETPEPTIEIKSEEKQENIISNNYGKMYLQSSNDFMIAATLSNAPSVHP